MTPSRRNGSAAADLSSILAGAAQTMCDTCGVPVSAGAARCSNCGGAVGVEPTIDVLEGAHRLRLARSEAGNLRKILQAFDDVERARQTPAQAASVFPPLIEYFRRWVMNMRRVSPAHIAELDDLRRMLDDYIPLATRLIEQFEACRADLTSNKVAMARHHLVDITRDMERLAQLYFQYRELGY